MGQFSWLDCITGEQVVDNKRRDVYVLVPKEFRDQYGERIKEDCYDGYGHFGGYDIYDLVADWNRKALSEKPDTFLQWHKAKVSEFGWYEAYADLSKSRREVVETMKSDNLPWDDEWRWIGIELACYDEDNESLPYPIKITHDFNAVYEDCEPSKGDPHQGWEEQPKTLQDYLDDIEWAFTMFKEGKWTEENFMETVQEMRNELYAMDC